LPFSRFDLELDAATGARRGELLGLQWADLQGTQLLDRPLALAGRAGAEEQEIPRHHDSAHGPEEAPGARKKQQPFREHFGDSYQGDFIFCNPDGSPLKPETVSASVVAAIPESQAAQGCHPSHAAPHARLAPAGGPACS
jgi:integrase